MGIARYLTVQFASDSGGYDAINSDSLRIAVYQDCV